MQYLLFFNGYTAGHDKNHEKFPVFLIFITPVRRELLVTVRYPQRLWSVKYLCGDGGR